ncbi:MAG TPA: inner membrane-spanning protein YciB [Steroidobacteraceae bacterium]|jgi:intracellular septation protein|nr:inner membrane-spanning protein YciB [Steroidobacteraceae bacterium]
MRALLEFSPLLVFLIAYYLRDLYFATAALMVAMVALLIFDLVLTRKVPKMHLLSTVLILLFGSATLILRNAKFIQWKPTIFLWILALAFAGSNFVGAKPLAQHFLQPALGEQQIERRVWLRLTWAWAGFYLLLGLANILVALHAPERVWVNFKVIGLTSATLVFAGAQAAWLNARAPK